MGEGRGRLLLEAAQGWAVDAGADEVWVAGASPFTLWPGIDVSWTRALCLFEAAGTPVGLLPGMRYEGERCPFPEATSRRPSTTSLTTGRTSTGARWTWRSPVSSLATFSSLSAIAVSRSDSEAM